MTKNLVTIVVGGIILIALWGAWNAYQEGRIVPNADDNVNGTSTSPILDDEPDRAVINDMITVDRPLIWEQISSPLTVIGEARGTWYFEATAPMRLEDANGKVLAEHYVTAQGEWMSVNFVPFEGEISFTLPATDTGTLILERSNPSGAPENAQTLRIPVKFR